jgi:glucan 1,3-beta-glucosidase
MTSRESPRPKPRERQRRRRPRGSTQDSRSKHVSADSQSSTAPLSADSLAQLNRLNERTARESPKRPKRPREAREAVEVEEVREVRDRPRPRDRAERERRYRDDPGRERRRERERHRERDRRHYDEKPAVVERERERRKESNRRVVSGALLEEGDGRRLYDINNGYRRDGYSDDDKTVGAWFKGKKRICECSTPLAIVGLAVLIRGTGIIAGIFVLLTAIIIPVAVVISNKSKSGSTGPSGSSSSGDASSANVPTSAKGTYYDPGIWQDTADFNTTYTNATVGGLPIIGLFDDWDDSAKANDQVPAINQPWGSYAKTPARGVNLGGWLSLEPFITPSLFNYDSKLGIIDEYTLTKHLGAKTAADTLEKHYSSFVTEQTFIDIANAGLDHIRIPYSYWAVATYDDDPYVPMISWRYLLRAIEWARKHGLRINLDLHGIPGSQNGWNHSGRQGDIGWIAGPNGATNRQRSLDIHNQLSTFFAQDRYKNIIAFYGLANEPKMTQLAPSDVITWTTDAYALVRKNGISAYIVFGDGFMGLGNWQGQMTGLSGLVLDVHQYVIFNVAQVVWNHTAKIQYACAGWTQQTEESMNTATGFGPTLVAEWSQADTDCAQYLNNVGVGNRWTGTYNSGNSKTQVLSPICPTKSNCDCGPANADPSTYSDSYKKFLQTFAEAQMYSFEKGWGWFYWTWKTESSAQWSYEKGLAAGILPAKAYAPSYKCTEPWPGWSDLPENY